MITIRHMFHTTRNAGDACRGLTLIEITVTLLVLSILLVVAVPGIERFIVSNRLTSQTNTLLGDLSRARSEAAARRAPVTVCAAASANACDDGGTTEWNQGWIVFVDLNGNGATDAGDIILRYNPSLAGTTSVASADFAKTGALTYRPFGGFLPATNGSFTLCASGNNNGREINVSRTGRPISKRIDSCKG